MDATIFPVTLSKWGKCRVEIGGKYIDGTPVMSIFGDDGPIARMSVYVKGAKNRIGPDEILIKNWSENTEIYYELVEQGILIPAPGINRVPTGFVYAVICKVNPKGK